MHTLVGNGKQALVLLAQALRAGGARSVIAPRYCCAAMTLPFSLEGFSVQFVDVGANLLLKPTALANALQQNPGASVIHCETYGTPATPALLQVLADARSRGHKVILDATHSLLVHPSLRSAPPTLPPGPWDAALASLRKLLPVPDGAILTWQQPKTAARDPFTTKLTALARSACMRQADPQIEALGRQALKAYAHLYALYCQPPSSAPARERWQARCREARLHVCRTAQAQEDKIETALSPLPASASTQQWLQAASWQALIAARSATAQHIRSALIPAIQGKNLHFLHPPTGSAAQLYDACCLALRGSKARIQALAQVLADAGLWGPVAWLPPSGQLADGWAYVLTLPIEQSARADEIIARLRAALA